MVVPRGYRRLILDADALLQLTLDPDPARLVEPLLPAGSGSAAPTAPAALPAARRAGGRKVHQSQQGAACSLSEREMELLQLVAVGMSNQEIARTTSLSAHTVRNRLVRIYGKLDVNTRQAAVARAMQLSLAIMSAQ